MSRKLYITLFFAALLLNGCKEVDYTLFPEGYVRILSVKDSGVRYCTSGNTVTEYKDSVLVLKGGGNPDSDAFASLEIMTLDDACETFGYTSDMIEIIPENAFTITDSDNISLPGNQRSRYVPLVFSPSAIYARSLQAPDKLMVLPLELKSDTDTINTQSNKVLYCFDINGPVLEWEDNAEMKTQIEFLTAQLKLAVKVRYHESSLESFTCGLTDSGLDQLVSEYNLRHGTSYELLPSSSYSMNPFSVAATAQSAESELNLSRNGLVSDKEYLLPLKFEREGMHIDVSSDVKYLIVSNPKYSYREVEKSEWKVVFANCTDKHVDWGADRMIDGNKSTTWGTNWNSPLAQSGVDDYMYDNSGKIQHLMERRRNVGDVVVVIDLAESIAVGKIGFSKSNRDYPYNIDLKACEFYVADSFVFKPMKEGGSWQNYQTANEDNDWKQILTVSDIPKQAGDFWYDVPSEVSIEDRTGRYVKIRPTEVYRGPEACQLAEFYVSEIVAIDGKPVK